MKFSSIAVVLASLSLAQGQSVIGLHGSGTTNPSKCIWHIMDQFMNSVKEPVKMTYRAIGSSGGQAEFIGDGMTSDNHFGAGDIPFDAEDFAAFPQGSVVHFPFVLGAISFFHSVPVENGALELNSCLLAKIFNRDITDWTDPAILDVNPGLDLPSPYPIHVARRVQGSSSTASITQYLHDTCSEEWPENLVDKEIIWHSDTKGCEGSGGMTNCIRETPGTIGYIDSGHGHSEGLTEIELRNADDVYISSKESNERDGIMAATDNAGLPDELTGSFADVQLLNQPGTYTWPIVALSYIYIKKDLTFIQDPAAQTLLQAFLKALYSDDYIPECEEEFGFVRISGDLRQKALDTIDELVVSDGAPQWIFEKDTQKRVGQQDYVISSKRASYSEVEQDGLVASVESLMDEIKALKEKNAELEVEVVELIEHGHEQDDHLLEGGADQDTQLKAALALACVSFILWCLAIIGLIAKFVLHV